MIKKINFITLLFLIISTGCLAKRGPRHSITIDALQLLFESVNGKYTIRVHDQVALTTPVSFQFATFKAQNNNNLEGDEIGVRYMSGGVGAKYYPFNNALDQGFYVEPQIVAGHSKIAFTKSDFQPFSSPFIRANLLAGYGWIWNSGYSLNLSAGLFYNQSFSHESPHIKKAIDGLSGASGVLLTNIMGLTSGFGPAVEFSMGFSW